MIAAVGTRRRLAPISVLDADRDLAEGLDDQQFEEARRALLAPAIGLAKGDWDPRQAASSEDAHLGALVVEGILVREVAIGDSVCAELVGPGDLLRPWAGADTGLLVPCDVRWHVLEEARLAMLGRRFACVAARWPDLTSALVGRAVKRSHALALSATISRTTGLEMRLLMLFWHLADRWGKVCRDGVVVPIQMTHAVIGRLISARRPSVSTALKQLERDGKITRLRSGGWLLAGDPPHAALRQRVIGPDPPAEAPSPLRRRETDVREHGKPARLTARAGRTPAATDRGPGRSDPSTAIARLDPRRQPSRRPAA